MRGRKGRGEGDRVYKRRYIYMCGVQEEEEERGKWRGVREQKREGRGRWGWDNTDPSCNLIIPKFCGIVGQEDKD